MTNKKYFSKEEELEARRAKYHENRHKLLPIYKEKYQKNKEQILKKQKERYHNDPEWRKKVLLRNKEYNSTPEYKAKKNEKEKINRELWRDKLVIVLGGYKCNECHYDKHRFPLQIDHINGKGRQERKKHSDTSRYYKRYALDPELAKKELQILCANCNQIKRIDNDEF